MKSKVLIIEDDLEATRLLKKFLSLFEFEVFTAETSAEGMKLLKSVSPAIVLLDVMLPGKSGFEICREIRAESKVPVLMLTARGALNDRLIGLECGADDYLAKPYEPKELVLRMQAILRRTQPLQERSLKLRSGELEADLARASATLAGENLGLTSIEFSLLVYLMERTGETVSRDQLHRHVRGEEWDGLDRSVDMAMSRLRTKLNDTSKISKYVKTMWGEGYRFVGEVDRA